MNVHTHTTLIFAGALLALAAGNAAAQQPLYRSVGPDGRVTYSDRAPIERPAEARAGSATSSSSTDALPYELREVVARYPVTLYTGTDCAPCASARSLLTARGVPFTERTVTSNEEVNALKALSGEQSLPLGTIGSQQIKGFSDVEWTRYLDAAGYPKQSQLPPNYRQSEPTPLVAAKPIEKAAPERAATPAPRPAPPPVQPPAGNGNPAGIRF